MHTSNTFMHHGAIAPLRRLGISRIEPRRCRQVGSTTLCGGRSYPSRRMIDSKICAVPYSALSDNLAQKRADGMLVLNNYHHTHTSVTGHDPGTYRDVTLKQAVLGHLEACRVNGAVHFVPHTRDEHRPVVTSPRFYNVVALRRLQGSRLDPCYEVLQHYGVAHSLCHEGHDDRFQNREAFRCCGNVNKRYRDMERGDDTA